MNIKKPYFVVYKIYGDSGVSGRGTFLKQFKSPKGVEKLCEHLGSISDDRCHARVLYMKSR
jgi:hypothetical protein